MRIPHIYLPVPLSVGARIPLTPAAFNHVVRVLHLESGAALTLFNGTGGEFQAVLDSVTRRAATARIDTFIPRELESSLPVLLVQGVSRSEPMHYTLQKAVELGVTAIAPVMTARSVVNLETERLRNRLQHWRSVVVSACEQCGRNRLPVLLEPMSLTDWLQAGHRQGSGLVLDPLAKQGLRDISRPAGSVSLLIGPEGGLSRAEIALAEAAGFIAVRLGSRIMRTETAGLAALTAVQVLWGDLG
jgi:16S rRNA (uracil1498-N3)-methyltransferase